MKPRSYRPLRLVSYLAIVLWASSTALLFGRPSDASTGSPMASPNYVPSTGLGGYNWFGPVAQISAQWRVPTIQTPSCTIEGAYTWVGAQQKGRGSPFIQLGTASYHTGCEESISYKAFWSDTDADFQLQILMDVKANDLVSVDMTQIPSGWTLTFKDLTQGVTKRITVGYGTQTTFSQGEWIQEDPAPSTLSPTDRPYPNTSTVQIDDLLVNNTAPTLNLKNGQVLIAPNGISLVPSAITDDSFYFFQPTGIAKQYLDVARSRDAAVSPLDASLARWSHISKTDKRHIVAEVSHAIGESASALASLSLPADTTTTQLDLSRD